MSRNGIYEAIARLLIDIYEGKEPMEEMDAAELHTLLMVQEPFSSWFKRRVSQSALVRFRDYHFAPGNRAFIDSYPRIRNYLMSNLAMLRIASQEENLAGQRIREYLIQIGSYVSRTPLNM